MGRCSHNNAVRLLESPSGDGRGFPSVGVGHRAAPNPGRIQNGWLANVSYNPCPVPFLFGDLLLLIDITCGGVDVGERGSAVLWLKMDGLSYCSRLQCCAQWCPLVGFTFQRGDRLRWIGSSMVSIWAQLAGPPTGPEVRGRCRCWKWGAGVWVWAESGGTHRFPPSHPHENTRDTHRRQRSTLRLRPAFGNPSKT